MNMPERVSVIELQREQSYYLAGQGVFEFVGEMGRGLKGHPEEKQFRNAKVVYRFRPHHEYSIGKEKLVAIEAIKQGNKVHPIPSGTQLEAALAIVRTEPMRPEHNIEYKMNAGGVVALAEVLRDTKRIANEKLHQEARMALAYLLANHMQSALGEARDYVDCVVTKKPWPDGLPLMPGSRDAMKRVSAQFENGQFFTPSFIASLAHAAPSSERAPAVPAGVAVVASPLAVPASAPAPNVVARVSGAPLPPPPHIPGPAVVRHSLDHGTLTAPVAPPRSMADVGGSISILTSFGHEATGDEEAEDVAAADASAAPHKRDIVKFFNPKHYDRAAVIVRSGKLYQQISTELTGQRGMMALVDAAVETGMKQNDVMYLTRAMFTKDKLSMTNVVRGKNHDKAPGEAEWDVERARNYYHALIDGLLKAVPERDQAEAHAATEILYSHIDISPRKATRSAAPVPAASPSPLPPAAAPAPVADVAANDTPPPMSLIPVPPEPIEVVDPDDEPETDADRIVGQFSIAVRRRREEPISPAVVRELEVVIKTPQNAPMALLAADRLSPIAFEIFSGVALHRKDMSKVAEELGTSEDTVRRVFTMAAHVVRGASQALLRSQALRPSFEEIPPHKTYG